MSLRTMNYSKLETLINLKNAGELTDEEFEMAKDELKKEKESPFKRGNHLNMEVDEFNMLLHLTQYCGILIPIVGSCVPIILWLQNKDVNPKIDLHGRIVFNWVFSVIIYFVCSVVLGSVIIGLFALGILILLDIIFPLVGTFKAKKGIAWRYPFSINFFNVKDAIEAMNKVPESQLHG